MNNVKETDKHKWISDPTPEQKAEFEKRVIQKLDCKIGIYIMDNDDVAISVGTEEKVPKMEELKSLDRNTRKLHAVRSEIFQLLGNYSPSPAVDILADLDENSKPIDILYRLLDAIKDKVEKEEAKEKPSNDDAPEPTHSAPASTQ